MKTLVDGIREYFNKRTRVSDTAKEADVSRRTLVIENGEAAARLLKNADFAMHRAKAEKRGSYSFYAADIHARARRDVALDAELARALERTLGVPIFQEQVMQLAIVAAGFTPGEADQLRRAMAAWKRKGGLEPFRDRLYQGMAERGYPQAFAEQIYQQILGFGEYGFPESHSASFALLAYVSSWLKHYEPAAFLAGMLNSQPLGFYSASQLVQDAQRHGVEILPVDVCASDWDCTLPAHNTVRLGLCMVSGLAQT